MRRGAPSRAISRAEVESAGRALLLGGLLGLVMIVLAGRAAVSSSRERGRADAR
jgi:hypothetical protein